MSVNTLIAVNSSAGDVATSLPWAGNMSGKTYLIKKVVFAGNVTVSGNFIENEGTVTLDGGATGSLQLCSMGSLGWGILSLGDASRTLFLDDFNEALSSSRMDPASRASGSLSSR